MLPGLVHFGAQRVGLLADTVGRLEDVARNSVAPATASSTLRAISRNAIEGPLLS
jgi:hypothetical protein